MTARSDAESGAAPRRPRNDGRGSRVREVRERLAEGTDIKPEFEYELLSALVRGLWGVGLIVPALAVVCAGAVLIWATPLNAGLWLAAALGAHAALLFETHRFRASPRGKVRVGVWRQRLLAIGATNGVAWAGLAVVVSLTGSGMAHMFLLAALVALLAVRMAVEAPVPRMFLAGSIPPVSATAFALLFAQDPSLRPLAGFVVVIAVAAYFLTRALHETALAVVEFKAEKDALIAEVEAEKGICNEARRNAEDASLAKSRFLATMSHELRTPLNAILGFSEVMMCEVLGPMQNGSYKDYAGNIHASGKHLLQLINEILDLSRIEAGRYELHEEAVRLTDVVEDCLRLLHLRAESKGLEVVLEFPKGLDLMWVDERAMRQICLNLISNAIKFTPRGGCITLNVSALDDGGQMLSVRDNGPGIPKEEIPRVMEAFGQGSLAHQTAEGGTGLGLPIVNNLVSLHGGEFELRSELRKGTEVIVKLPKSRVLKALPPLQPLGQERHKQRPARVRAA